VRPQDISRSVRAPRRRFLKGAAMSTEDDREKRRKESPEWHRARAKSLRAKMQASVAERLVALPPVILGRCAMLQNLSKDIRECYLRAKHSAAVWCRLDRLGYHLFALAACTEAAA
jgi:hypothetical protein